MAITPFNIITLTGFSNSLNAYLARFTVQPSTARIVIINTLINSLKNTGNWDLLDDLRLYAAEEAEHGHVNLIHPEYPKGVVVDAPTFTANQGFQMDGVNDSLNSNFLFPLYRKNFQLNSASAFVWSRTTAQSNIADAGGVNGANTAILTIRNTSNNMTGRICDASTESSTATHTDGVGLFMINRPTDSIKQFFRNGTQLGADIARASIGVPNSNTNPFHYGSNQAGTFGTRQIAIGGLGGGHTPTQALNLYNALATFATAVGF